MERSSPKSQTNRPIRTRLLRAFAVIVLISLTAVLFSWVSVTRTRDKLDVVVSKTLPLVSSSLRLDKSAQLFAISINEFHELHTDREHELLNEQIEGYILEIEKLLKNLESLDFDNHRILFIRTRIQQLVDAMAWQNEQFHQFTKTNKQLKQAVSDLRDDHREFITLTNPRIADSYLDFLQKSDEISAEMRHFISFFSNQSTDAEIRLLDDKLRVAFDTLVSAAAGEMRFTLEAVAHTYHAAGLLYEAAGARSINIVNELEKQFLQLLPKIRTIRLVLSHSTPNNHTVIITAIPVFDYGRGNDTKGTGSIFSLRREELLIRDKAALSAGNALTMAQELTAAINDLNSTTKQLAYAAAEQLRSDLRTAQMVQISLGVTGVIFSFLIVWIYVEKGVISRISALRKAMELSSRGGEPDIPISGNDEISYMAGALQNFVDQRTRVESRLRTTLDELNAVLDNIDYGIVFMDERFNVLLTNRALLRMWDIPAADATGNPPIGRLINVDKLKKIYTSQGKEIDKQTNDFEAILCNGITEPIEIETTSGRVFQHQSFELPGSDRMLTFFDITDLKVNQARLIQAKKTETIGLMAGGVAHDLNNILSGVVSYPDLLLVKLPEDSDLIEPIQTIKKSGQRAAAVVADLLTVTRGTVSQQETTNLNSLVKQYLTSPEGMQLKTLYPDITISVNLHPALLNISCVPQQIKKCLMNLIVNATEAIGSTGTVVISTENRFLEKKAISNTDLKSNEFVALIVRDNGPGISDNDIEHIFEPFYSRKVMGRSGTGLGLTIVWNTVRDHDGTVNVHSSDSGTQFEVYLPATRAVEQARPDSGFTTDIGGNNQHILVVDDEPMQRDIAGQILATLGYRVTTASSGEEAVELIKKQEFDLTILDMIMSPGINGRQTYEQIIAIRPGQRAVIASGYSGTDEVERTRTLGATEFLNKPYTLQQIGKTIKKALTDEHGNKNT